VRHAQTKKSRLPFTGRPVCLRCKPQCPDHAAGSGKNFARDIYKEFVEIQSGYTTGSTTPVAEAAAARLRAAGFSGSAIFVGGADPKKANLVVRYRCTGAFQQMAKIESGPVLCRWCR
jgi:hypothetical protein